jgi:hypothetical protein
LLRRSDPHGLQQPHRAEPDPRRVSTTTDIHAVLVYDLLDIGASKSLTTT